MNQIKIRRLAPSHAEVDVDFFLARECDRFLMA
jgi:hypothetical protein